MKVSDTIGITEGKRYIAKEAKEIGEYYLLAGIGFLTDFFSVDKYGLSFRGVNAESLSDARVSQWGWNSDHWYNYLLYCTILGHVINDSLGPGAIKKSCVLWQIPTGHLNRSVSRKYDGTLFKELRNVSGEYEDSSVTFFFGDTFKPRDHEFEYFSKNEYDMDTVEVDLSKREITWSGVFKELGDYNIIAILCGAGVGMDTHSGGLAREVTDDGFFFSKIREI